MRTLAAGIALLTLGAMASPAAQRPAMSLDHVVLAVNDLEAVSALYARMGFALKPGRPHANGIRNQHVKFRDGTELELLTAPAAADDLTRRYRAHLAAGDGPAYLALFPKPAPPARSAAPPYIFFGVGNHSPTDREEHFAHRNGATTLAAVWLAGSNFSTERALFSKFGAVLRPGRLSPLDADAEQAVLDGGSVYLLPERLRVHRARPIVGVTFDVADIARAADVLRLGGVAFSAIRGSIVIDPSVARGLWVELK